MNKICTTGVFPFTLRIDSCMPRRRPPRPADGPTPPRTTKRKLSSAELEQLKEFAKLLEERRSASRPRISLAALAEWTRLRKETVRSYLDAINRPTKASLRRLTMIFGPDLAAPFEGTELSGPEEEPIKQTHLPDGRAILFIHMVMSEELMAQIVALIRNSGEVREARSLYLPPKR